MCAILLSCKGRDRRDWFIKIKNCSVILEYIIAPVVILKITITVTAVSSLGGIYSTRCGIVSSDIALVLVIIVDSCGVCQQVQVFREGRDLAKLLTQSSLSDTDLSEIFDTLNSVIKHGTFEDVVHWGSLSVRQLVIKSKLFHEVSHKRYSSLPFPWLLSQSETCNELKDCSRRQLRLRRVGVMITQILEDQLRVTCHILCSNKGLTFVCE